MIVFDLKCRDGHVFEGWFGSSGAYDDQRGRGLIACPVCGDTAVGKAVMAPNVAAKGNRGVTAPPASPPADEAIAVQNVPKLSNQAIPPQMQEMIAKLARAQAKMLEKSTWVGKDFAEKARAIHYGEADDAIIHGQTTPEQAQDLLDEGVAVAPLPLPYVPPDAQN